MKKPLNLLTADPTTRQCTRPAFPATSPAKIATLFLPVTRLNFEEKERSTHVHDPPGSDNHLDARAVRRRAHRLRAWPIEAFWQQRRRVPQGARPGLLAGRRHGRLGRHLG